MPTLLGQVLAVKSSLTLLSKACPAASLTPLPVCVNTQGPTLTLRVKGYSLMSDVASSQSRPRVPPNAFKTAPLVVLNNFSPQQKQLALAANLFQGMFLSINVHTVNLSTCQVRGGSSSSSSGGCSFIQD